MAAKYNIEAVSRLPINPDFARLVDAGKVEDVVIEDALAPIIDQIL